MIQSVVDTLLKVGAYRATKYVSPKWVITATRRLCGGKILRRTRFVGVVLKLGAPNYREREFIKKLKKAGEPFPVKKVQLQFPTKR